MSGLYTVLPLTADLMPWLTSQGIPAAPPAGAGRFPTLIELRQTLALLAEFEIHGGDPDPAAPWKIVLTHKAQPDGETRTVLGITEYQGEEQPHGFWFEEGWPPLMIATLQRLAAFTGPLVLLATKDGSPTLIDANSDVGQVLATWKHTAA